MEKENLPCNEDCDCAEDLSAEDIANHADDKVDALVALLIKKGVISEIEYNKAFESLFDNECEDDDEDDEED